MKIVKPIAIGLVALFAASSVAQAESIRSMRQADKLLGESVIKPAEKYPDAAPGKNKPLIRAYKGAPAQIPHTIEGMGLTSKVRRHECLKCHDRTRAEEEKAPSAPPSHYRDHTGKQLKGIHGRRLNCTQCHVPLSDAELRVENYYGGETFDGTLEGDKSPTLGW